MDILTRMLSRAAEWNLVKGLKMGMENLEIYHLLLVENMILFLKKDSKSMSNALAILHMFEHNSGLKQLRENKTHWD